jgi:hypothetical protein
LIQIRFQQTHAHTRVKGERLHLSPIRHDRERVHLSDAAVALSRGSLDAQEPSRQLRSARPHFEPRASQGRKEGGAIRLRADRQPKRAEPAIQTRF